MIARISLPENFWGSVIATLSGVIIGFVLNFLKDLYKERKDKRKKKTEIIRKIVSTSKLYEQYAFMLFEYISTSNYFKSRNKYIDDRLIDDKKVPLEMIESWRKDYENYRLKIIELDSGLSEIISEFHSYFGENKMIDKKKEKIVLMECGFSHTFDTIEKVRNYSEPLIYSEISEELNKEGRIAYLLKDLINYVQGLKY